MIITYQALLTRRVAKHLSLGKKSSPPFSSQSTMALQRMKRSLFSSFIALLVSLWIIKGSLTTRWRDVMRILLV
jgi:hypothetical protein